MTDALQLLTANTAIAARENGQYFQKRYLDVIEPPKQETRTAEEVIAHIRNKIKEV